MALNELKENAEKDCILVEQSESGEQKQDQGEADLSGGEENEQDA